MALTNEFYRTLHILEMNYGSITNVPDDNEDVIRLIVNAEQQLWNYLNKDIQDIRYLKRLDCQYL